MHTLLSVLATTAFVVAVLWLSRALIIQEYRRWRRGAR